MKKIMIVYLIISIIVISNIDAQWIQTKGPFDNSWVPKDTTGGVIIESIIYSNESDKNNLITGIWARGIFLSTDSGNSWKQINDGLSNYVTSLVIDNKFLFAGIYDPDDGGVYRSSDNGDSWVKLNNTLIGTYINRLFILSDGNEGTILYATTDTDSYYSSNEGTSWSEIGGGLPKGRFNFTFGNSETNKLKLFAYGGQGIYVSSDFGNCWSKTNTDSIRWMTGWGYESGISAFTELNGILFAGTHGGGLYSSNDNGKHWTSVTSAFTEWYDLFIDCFAIYNNNILLGTTGNTFISSDYGESWSKINEGLSPITMYNSTCYAITSFVTSNTDLFAGTNERGIWRRNLSEITSVKNNLLDLPRQFQLEQNYPNPFNPTTTINYSLPKQSNVEIKIYDILGREVAVLVNEEKPAGSYNIHFDGQNLSSGVYFCTMRSNTFSQTRKLLLIK